MVEQRVHLLVAAVAVVSPDAQLAAPDAFLGHDSRALAVAQPDAVALVVAVAALVVVLDRGSQAPAVGPLAVAALVAAAGPDVVPGASPVHDLRVALEQLAVAALAAAVESVVVPDHDSRVALQQPAAVAQPVVFPDLVPDPDRDPYLDRDRDRFRQDAVQVQPFPRIARIDHSTYPHFHVLLVHPSR